jgi:hypothetical protein
MDVRKEAFQEFLLIFEHLLVCGLCPSASQTESSPRSLLLPFGTRLCDFMTECLDRAGLTLFLSTLCKECEEWLGNGPSCGELLPIFLFSLESWCWTCLQKEHCIFLCISVTWVQHLQETHSALTQARRSHSHRAEGSRSDLVRARVSEECFFRHVGKMSLHCAGCPRQQWMLTVVTTTLPTPSPPAYESIFLQELVPSSDFTCVHSGLLTVST